MSKCYKGGSKHKFKPRYEEHDIRSDFVDRMSVRTPNVNDLRKVLLREVYVRDVCEWCGKTIERS